MNSNSKKTHRGKNKTKILKIVIASTIGIVSLSAGTYFVVKHFTNNHQQETNLQPIIDEINALNSKSTLLEIDKANDEYNALSASDRNRVPEETKNHLIEQTNLYNRDKRQVDALKGKVAELPVDTSSDAEIKEVEDELTDVTFKAGKRGTDFTILIDEIKTKVESVRDSWNSDKKKFAVYLEFAKELSNDATISASGINEYESAFECSVAELSDKRYQDFSSKITETRAYINLALSMHRKDKKIVDNFANFTEELDGVNDTKEEIEEGYVLMQAANKIKRTDLLDQIKVTKEKFQSYMNNFVNDENAAKTVIKSISDIYESADDFVLDMDYVNQISSSYGALNERSKGLANTMSIEKWDKNIEGEINYLKEAVSNGNQVNAQLNKHKKFRDFYVDDESKFQILSIKVYYDQLDIVTQKVITLENREKFAVCSEIGLENAYSFTELNGSSVAEKGEHLWWDGTTAHDGYGYFAKGTLSNSDVSQILTIDEATTLEIKSRFNKIKFYARVSNEGKVSEQLLSLKVNDTLIGTTTKLKSDGFTLVEISTDDLVSGGPLEFFVSNSNSEEIAMTFIYGEPKA